MQIRLWTGSLGENDAYFDLSYALHFFNL
jgi:hypothetical protein